MLIMQGMQDGQPSWQDRRPTSMRHFAVTSQCRGRDMLGPSPVLDRASWIGPLAWLFMHALSGNFLQ